MTIHHIKWRFAALNDDSASNDDLPHQMTIYHQMTMYRIKWNLPYQTNISLQNMPHEFPVALTHGMPLELSIKKFTIWNDYRADSCELLHTEWLYIWFWWNSPYEMAGGLPFEKPAELTCGFFFLTDVWGSSENCSFTVRFRIVCKCIYINTSSVTYVNLFLHMLIHFSLYLLMWKYVYINKYISPYVNTFTFVNAALNNAALN